MNLVRIRVNNGLQLGKMAKFRVLELYSGIGGMHFALSESEIPFELVAAVDINTTANQIYQHNFPETKLLNRCIESMSVTQLNSLKFNMLLMSPPCQPFCRVGKQQDTLDERTKSFLYLLDVLPQHITSRGQFTDRCPLVLLVLRLANPPAYILVENVKGFDTSESRKRLMLMLHSLEYEIQEFFLSPLQFGIPNSRLRYYLIAKRKPLKFSFDTTEGICSEIPQCCEEFIKHRSFDTPQASSTEMESNPELHNSTSNGSLKGDSTTSQGAISQDETDNMIGPNSNETAEAASLSQSGDSLEDEEDLVDNESELPLSEKYKSVCKCVGEFLQKDLDEAEMKDYLLPEKFYRRFWVMDIVTTESKNSCCFTKRYAHHMEGSGSIIQMNTEHEHDLSYYKQQRVYNDTVQEAVRQRQLRFFSPREIANLMCFPKELSFPKDITNIQCYRVLGNSLNVHVVSVLIRLLVKGDNQ